MTLPNLITILRLMLVPLVVLMIVQGRLQTAFVLFVVAGISDAVDGAIARRFNMKSELGAYLDPLADKALIVSIYVALAITNVIPAWLTILVVARDIMIVSAVIISWVMDKPVEIAPIIVSKLNTGAQIAFAALVLGARGFDYAGGPAFEVAQVGVATLTLASMGAYLALWFRHMSE
jgi:cardiolipin synthase